MKNLLSKHIRFLAVTCALIGAATLGALILSTQAAAQQVDPFLSVPYYGAELLTAYFDHDSPGGAFNNRIELYDDRVIQSTNGACGWNNLGKLVRA